MAISSNIDILEHQLFIQGDARDPLGVWGARIGITGDATGTGIKIGFRIPAEKSGARIYTCYDVNAAGLTGALLVSTFKVRLLTNHPDIDISPGLQGYASLLLRGSYFVVNTGLTAPIGGLLEPVFRSNERFILLFGTPGIATTIVETELEQNVDGGTYSFEAYGYFWDREVLYAPGGPRHPGSG